MCMSEVANERTLRLTLNRSLGRLLSDSPPLRFIFSFAATRLSYLDYWLFLRDPTFAFRLLLRGITAY